MSHKRQQLQKQQQQKKKLPFDITSGVSSTPSGSIAVIPEYVLTIIVQLHTKIQASKEITSEQKVNFFSKLGLQPQNIINQHQEILSSPGTKSNESLLNNIMESYATLLAIQILVEANPKTFDYIMDTVTTVKPADILVNANYDKLHKLELESEKLATDFHLYKTEHDEKLKTQNQLYHDQQWNFMKLTQQTDKLRANHQRATQQLSEEKRKSENLQKTVDKLKTDKPTHSFDCPICYELMNPGIVCIPCGHVYCGACILRLGKSCSLCRKSITSTVTAKFGC